ncbi:hypothetical protein HK101_002263, partial [Irineochytrium annulatum]
MPADHRIHKKWLNDQIEHVKNNPRELVPVLKEFEELIEKNARIYMYFTAMFDEVPAKRPYQSSPTGHTQIKDYQQMLQVLNHIITTAPSWTEHAERVGLVGTPINACLDWPMGTPSGNAAFLDPQVNAMLKKVLNEWGKFLKSPGSAYVLKKDKHGWFGETAVHDLSTVANKASGTEHAFADIFVCDPAHETHGFKSWDDFFTRELRDGVRPVASPEDDAIIANACESKPFNIQRDAKLRDKFWTKGQPYSVGDMLGHDPLASQFAGCTVYQAFLSALSYHRWHSPVSGTITRAFVCDGTYYSEPLWEGLGDPNGLSTAQGYIAQLACRAVIFIQADNPNIGLMAFIGIGMDEVSTCDITVKEGEKIKKGEQLGMFHFGGSSHCLLFRKGVELEFVPQPGQDHNVPVRSKLAVVKGKKRAADLLIELKRIEQLKTISEGTNITIHFVDKGSGAGGKKELASTDVMKRNSTVNASQVEAAIIASLKVTEGGIVTKSAHPARFSPDDKFSRHRVTLKRRFGLLLTQQPAVKKAKVFREHTKRITSLDFDGKGEYCLTVGDDDALHMYDCQTGTLKKTSYSKKYGCSLGRFTHRSNNVLHASTKDDHAIRYLSFHDNKYLRYFKGHTARVTALEMSPTDDQFLSASKDGSVRLWDLRSGTPTGLVNVQSGRINIAFDPSNKIFAVGTAHSSEIRLYNMGDLDRGPFTILRPNVGGLGGGGPAE